MSLDILLTRLLKEGKLRKQSTGDSYLNNLLYAAQRNFEAALLIKGRIDEASFKLFYDGILQIGRLILLINGYRPGDGEQHKTTISVAGELLGSEFEILMRKIQRFRIKRNNCLYNPQGLISKSVR